jgi:hypothetical protein
VGGHTTTPAEVSEAFFSPVLSAQYSSVFLASGRNANNGTALGVVEGRAQQQQRRRWRKQQYLYVSFLLYILHINKTDYCILYRGSKDEEEEHTIRYVFCLLFFVDFFNNNDIVALISKVRCLLFYFS